MTAKSVFSFVQIAKFLVATTTIALTFVACGDDSGNSNAANNENIGNSFDEVREVATTQDLGRCTSEREGDTVYVVEKMRDYICINHAWIDASENLGTTPSGGENTPSSSSENNTPAATTSSSSSAQDTPATITSSSSSAQDTPATITSSSSSKTESSSSITVNSSSSEAEPPSTHRDVEDVYSVGECSLNIEGHTVFVKSNLVTYICEDGVWSVYIAPNTQTSSSSAISSTVPAYSEIADIMQLGKCTKESANAVALVKKDTSYYTCVNGNWIQSEEHGYVIQKRSILGVAQKGPFKFGAPVYLRELAGDDLHYTGKVYEDEISSNKGDFVIPNVNMIYPYASVEVKGQYRNEMTGAYSSAPISLFALTDLQTDSRTKVNVNLLTHLEYGRAMYLVRKGYSVYAAKRQADQEIMTAFELPTTVKFSEDLSVFEDSEDDNVDYANASLMVLDLLFLGERRDDEVVALIGGFAKDFEKDGVWDDDSTKAVMADFATEVDGDEVRANVKTWNILDIPAFESQLEMFWNNVYGLGGCTSVRNGVIANNKNKFSKNFDVYYKCSAGSWIKATQLEYDTYGWEAGTTGEVKKGNVTNAKYVYRNGKWNQASVEEGGLGSCLAKNEGTILTYESDYYVCKSSNWTKLTVAQADTYGWTAGEVGEVKKGTFSDAKYVYRAGKWNLANELETSLGSCVTGNAGTVSLSGDTYYICKTNKWTNASVLEYDTYGWTAGETGEVKKGDVTGAMYVYRNSKWSAASELETLLGSCMAGNAGTVSLYGGKYYICKANEWIEASVFEYDTYGWTAGETGEVKKGNVTEIKYVYRDGKWSVASELETLLGSCVAKNEGSVSLSNGTYYICKASEWIEASVLEYDTYGLNCSKDGALIDGLVNASNKYVCDAEKFRIATEDETALNLGCTSYNQNHTLLFEDEWEIVTWICLEKWNKKDRSFKYGSLKDSRDNQTYKTVKIGNQIWMAENLNYAPGGVSSMGSYAWSGCYNNMADSCAKYGRLYTWEVAMNKASCAYDKKCNATLNPAVPVRGVCPQGWHLPSHYEFEELINFIDPTFGYGGHTTGASSSTTGKYLKSKTGWNYYSASTVGTDAYGFSALPGGYRNSQGNFDYAGHETSFWSSGEYYSEKALMAYVLILRYNFEKAVLDGNTKFLAHSVRCLQD